MDPRDQGVAVSATVRAPQHVLVAYEASADGRTALSHACDLTHAAGARLSVVVVVDQERTDVGCARCRWNASMWNNELGMIAEEELAEAATLVRPAAAVDYEVARGRPAAAIAESAKRCGADLIVVPWRRPGRIRQLFARDLVERLRQEGRWQVVVAPGAGAKTG